MKKCPYCAEDILDKAIKCKHCESDLHQKDLKKEKQQSSFIGDKDKKVLKWIGKIGLVIFAIVVWYISIPVIIIWYIWKKSKWDKKKKYIGTVLTVVLFSILGGVYSHLNRAPSIVINEPNDGFTVQSRETVIKGTIDPKDAILKINGKIIKVDNGVFIYMVKLSDEKNVFTLKVSNSNGQSTQKITINRTLTEEELTEREAKKQAAIEAQRKAKEEREAKELAEQKVWEQSNAGQICTKHPEWSKTECKRLADNKIWIGMTLDMLKYQRGLPDSANPSNYGAGTEWQWCWHGYTPFCFYGDDDGIVDSYN